MTFHLARRLLVSCISTTALIIALAAPSGAGAALGAQCSGVSITGQGANVLKNAHTVWDADFNTSTSKVACAGLKGQGTLQEPTVTYKTSSAAVGLESWGANGHVGLKFIGQIGCSFQHVGALTKLKFYFQVSGSKVFVVRAYHLNFVALLLQLTGKIHGSFRIARKYSSQWHGEATSQGVL